MCILQICLIMSVKGTKQHVCVKTSDQSIDLMANIKFGQATSLKSRNIGSNRHILHAVELSYPVQIMSTPPTPVYHFFCKPAMWTRWMAGTAPHKSGRCRGLSRSNNIAQESLDLRYLPQTSTC